VHRSSYTRATDPPAHPHTYIYIHKHSQPYEFVCVCVSFSGSAEGGGVCGIFLRVGGRQYIYRTVVVVVVVVPSAV